MPDLIGRRFAPGAPDVAWVGDTTHIATGEGWLYLASVLDLGSRRWLGYSMADHMRTELIADALDMAVGARGGQVRGTFFHGDRGSQSGQYLSHEYRQQVVDYGMVQSVGRTGVCWDNSVAESAWSSLKRELVHRYRFNTRAENPPGNLRVDQPLQHTPTALHPRLHRPHHLGAAMLSTQGQPGRVTNVTGQLGEAQFNHRRLHGEVTKDATYTTPVEAEIDYYRQTTSADRAVTQ